MAYKIADGYVDVHGRLDDGSFRRAAHRAGGRAGDHFATAFGLSSSRRFRRMTGMFMEPINAISSALSAIRGPSLRVGILSAILGLIPSAGKAAAALGASLIPALFSLGSVIGVVRLMLGKLQSDIKGQTLKALNDMAGSIRDLAREAAKPGLNKLMEGVVKNGPLFERYIQRIARAVGDALGELGDLLGDSGFVNKLNSLLEQTAESTSIWTRSLDDVVEMLVTLGDAASPIFRDMAERVNVLTDRWRDFLNLKYETGELQQFLQDAAEELNRWGRIFNNVIIGLFNIFAAGVGPSSEFAANLERITRSFRDWTEQSGNVEKVRAVFQWLIDHVDDFFRIAAAAGAIALALKGIGAAVAAINFVQLAASLGTFGVVLGAAGLAIAGVAGMFFLAWTRSEAFRSKLGELWTMFQERLLPTLKEWGTWINENLLPLLDRLATQIMGAVVAGFDHVLTKIQQNKQGLQEFGDVVLRIAPILAGMATAFVVHAAAAVGAIITMIGWIGRLVGFIKKIPKSSVTKYLFQPGAALSLIGRVTGATKAIPRAWRTLMRFIGGGGAVGWALRVTGAVRRIPRSWRTVYRFFIGGALTAINRVIGALSRIPRNVTTTVTSVTRNITESITRFGSNLFRASGGIIGAQGMATGGISGSRNVVVGEQGPEMVRLPFGSSVVPAGQTRAQLNQDGPGGRVVIEVRSGGSRLDDLLVELLRKSIRGRAGGRRDSVQVVLGQ